MPSGLRGTLGGFGGAVGGLATVLTFTHRGVLVHALLTFPLGRATSMWVRAGVLAGYLLTIVPAVWANPYSAVALAAAIVGATFAAAYRAPGRFRRARRAAAWAALVLAAGIVTGAVVRALAPTPALTILALWGYDLAVGAAAMILLSSLLSGSWRRREVADLVIELGPSRGRTLRDALAWALGDPSVRIERRDTPTPGRAGTAQLHGAGRVATEVMDTDGGPLATIAHAPGVLDDPALADSVAEAVRLEVAGERLRSEVRSQLSAVRASQQRLLRAADEEGRRLEDRLRKGAAMRLSYVAELLDEAEAETRSPAVAAQVAELRLALVETDTALAGIARGLYPRVLEEAGLAGALVQAVATSDVTVRVDVEVDRVDSDLALAIYYCALEAISNIAKHAAATRAAVTVSCRDGVLVLDVSDDGGGGARPGAGSGLNGVVDRIGALDGTVRITSPVGEGTRILVEVPMG